jgi:HEAT repeat protein
MFEKLNKALTSENFEEKRAAVEGINPSDVTSEIVKVIVPLLKDQNQGVRDAVSRLLLQSDEKSICKEVVPYISSKEISIRNLAGEILLKKGTKAIPAIMEYLKHADDDDQKFLIDILGLIGDQSVEDEIIKVLKISQNDNVVLACIEALGNIKSGKSFGIIKEKYSENELYHPTIFEALGKIGTDEALSFINKEYQQSDDLSKFAMIESLGIVGNEEIFYTLLSELRELKGPLTWAIIEALAKLKDKLHLSIPFDESMKNTLVAVINEADDQYKIAASKLVSDFTDDEILKVSLQNFGRLTEFNENVKNKFFENPVSFYKNFIDTIKTTDDDNELFELFKKVITKDNGEGLQQLSGIEYRNMCDVFTVKLESPDEEVRRSAMELLFFLCLDTAMMFLDVMVRDSNVWNRARLLEFLEQIEDEEVIPFIKILAEDEEGMIKDQALEIISNREIE